MKAPQEIKENLITSLRAMDDEIRQKEMTLQGYEGVVTETKESLKNLRAKRKEYFAFAKKLGVKEEDVGRFVAEWNGEIPATLTDEERNSRLAGIVNSWQNGETDA